MSTTTSQITSRTTVYSTVYSSAGQRKRQSPASLAFVWGIHWWPVNSPHKGPVTREMFPFHYIIMHQYIRCFVVLLSVLCVKYWNISENCFYPARLAIKPIEFGCEVDDFSRNKDRRFLQVMCALFWCWYTNANVVRSSDIVLIIIVMHIMHNLHNNLLW